MFLSFLKKRPNRVGSSRHPSFHIEGSVPGTISKTRRKGNSSQYTQAGPPPYDEDQRTRTDPPPSYGKDQRTQADLLLPYAQDQEIQRIPSKNQVEEDPYAFLSNFDTIFLIDDSGSMAGRSWEETSNALAAIAPICAAHDNDGVEVVFMNTQQRSFHKNLRTAEQIRYVFNSTRPGGATPTGSTLNSILKPYLREIETKGPEGVKPLNIIVITDGVPTDDPESVIVTAAKKLERLDCPSWQVGIQFFQVGSEPGAAEALAELDDGLVEMGCPRDIVDTVPWKSELSAQSMLKIVLGAVNRRLDRRRIAGEAAQK